MRYCQEKGRVMLNGIEICGTIADRLAAIDDILGDEYDMDELRKAIAALRREQE